jgi:hypothetical protein
MTKLIVNCSTGEETVRELNAEELAQQAIDQEANAARQAQEDAEAQAKAEAKAALLAKLGITADEAKLLLS